MNPLFSALADAFGKVTGAWLYFIGSEVVLVTSAVSLLLANSDATFDSFNEPPAPPPEPPSYAFIAYVMLGFVLLRAAWLMGGLLFAKKAIEKAVEKDG